MRTSVFSRRFRFARFAGLVAALALSATAVAIGPSAQAADTGPTLDANHSLASGDWLTSRNGAYRLVMQTDGNLVEYGPGGPIWASYTSGNGAYLANQGDGNIVVYGPGWTWATGTNGRGAAQIVVQDDGNVVAYGPSGPTWSTYTNGGANKLKATGAVAYAKRQLGKPYVYGASGPNGFDCSGLTSQAYASVGVGIPRTSQDQYRQGSAVGRTDLQPGDLVFYRGAGASPGHVAVYIGNGQIIEALKTGTPVSVHPLDYPGGYVGARRIA